MLDKQGCLKLTCKIENHFSRENVFLHILSKFDFTLLADLIFLDRAVHLSKVVENYKALSEPVSVSDQLKEAN